MRQSAPCMHYITALDVAAMDAYIALPQLPWETQ